MEFLNCFSSHIICSAEKPNGVPGKRYRNSKKRGSNPYAERGLDRFAVVSAELEAKRKKLVAQLGSQLSFVRFAIGSNHHDWIPIIVCPTLSKAEIRTLESTATRLIAEDRDTIGSAGAQHIHTRGVSTQDSSRPCYEVNNALDHNHDQPGRVSVAHVDNPQNGTLNYLLEALERCLWMAAFAFSIAADIFSTVFLSKWHAAEVPPQRILPSSTRRPKPESDNPSPNMSSSMNLSSLPRIRAPASISAKDIKVTTPSHSTAHAGAVPAKVHNICKSPGFSTAPSTPRDSRQVKKSFQASVSFPTTTHLQVDEAPPSSITKDSTFLKSLSLPMVFRSQEHVVQRSATSKAKMALQKRKRKEGSEKLGQALTGAWLALGLGGLVMGYIPAIICVVCWWYALPSLRRAVGDKPYVKSHHR